MFSSLLNDRRSVLTVAAGTAVGSAFVYKLFYKWKTTKGKDYIREKLRIRKHTEIQTLQSKFESIHASTSSELVELSVTQLVERLHSGDVTPHDVLQAYQAKAISVHRATNCLTGVIVGCEQKAKELEARREEKLPLYGVPVSIKDSITLEGYPDTWGCINRGTVIGAEDAVVVKVLEAQGAIPFVRTNVPQILLAFESSNPIYGGTCNPMDSSRGSGGSSGGESALIGGGGSVIGMGTDIGGSIRNPCAFCGICGLKPGSGRLSNKTGNPPRGQTVVLPTVGPMARDVEGVVALMRSLLVPLMFELDPLIPPLPFREDVYRSSRPLTIGWFVDDGYHPAVPAIARAVGMAKEALETAGHTLVPWQPPHIHQATSALLLSIAGDKGAAIAPIFQGDRIDPCISFFRSLLYVSSFVRRLRSWYYHLKGNKYLSQTWIDFGGMNSVAEWWTFTTRVELYRRKFATAWKETRLDAVVGPACAVTAAKLGSATELQQMGSYTFLYNVMDIPAGVVPVTRVSREDVAALAGYSTGDHLGEWVRRDQAGSEGLPAGVQVAAMRWQEETVLRVMKTIQDGVRL